LQAVWLPAQTLTLPLGLPDLPFHLRVDPLAGFFLMLLGSVSTGISVYAAGYFREEASGRLALINLQYHVFLASMAFVLLADGGFSARLLRLRREGRHDPAARLASRGTPRRAFTGLGAHERSHDQDRHLRHGAGDLRPDRQRALGMGHSGARNRRGYHALRRA